MRGEHGVEGIKIVLIGELQVPCLQEKLVLPMQGSVRAIGYDVHAANSYILSAQSKDSLDTGIAVSLPLDTYVQIAPHLGLDTKRFIDASIGIIDLNCSAEVKVILFNHSIKAMAGD